MDSTEPSSSATPSGSHSSGPGTAPGISLASLSPEQLAAIFQSVAALHNSVTVPATPANPPPKRRSHRAAALTAAISSLPKLKEGSYRQWVFAIEEAVENAGLEEYLSGTVVRPADKDSLEYDLYKQEAGAVRAAITGSLDHETSYRYLGGTKTPKEAWDALKARYHVSDEVTLRAIDERLVSLRMEEGGNMVEHVALFKKLKRELEGSEFEVTPGRALQWLWNSLPTSYDHIVLLQKRSNIRDFDMICIELETHYRGISARSGPTVAAYAASTSRPVPVRDWNIPDDLKRIRLTGARNPALAARARNTCKDCLEEGHFVGSDKCNTTRYRVELWGPRIPGQARSNVRRSGNRQANVAETESDEIQVSANAAEIEDTPYPEFIAACASVGDETNSPIALAACSETAFLLDSGCQSHMTSIKTIFTRIEELATPIRIRGIGGSSILARCIGSVAIPTVVKGAMSWLRLENVLYAPDLGRNLISTGALMEAGLTVNFTADGASILKPNVSAPLATASLRSRLWVLDVDESIWNAQSSIHANAAITGLTWHKRLGHACPKVLQQLASTGAIPKLSKSDVDEIARCEPCAIGNASRKPFPVSTSRASQPLELLHSDICGPHEAAVDGSRYALMFLDDYSRMLWVCFLKAKSDAMTAFIQLRTLLEKSTGFQIKTLRTDNGDLLSELISAEWQDGAGFSIDLWSFEVHDEGSRYVGVLVG